MESKIIQLHTHAISLVRMFKQGGARDHIDLAIRVDRLALLLSPPGERIRIASSNQLSVHLSERYSQLGTMEDMDEAIVLDRDGLKCCPPGNPDRATILSSLAAHLATRYGQAGGASELDEAIEHGREALALRPLGHPDRLTSLNNVAIDLSVRYERLGGMEDLDEAIRLGRDALALSQPGHPDRPMILNNLVRYLSARYLRIKGMEDLDEAIAFGQEALTLCPPRHPSRSMALSNLSASLFTRFEKLKKKEDIDEAIVFGRAGLALRPPGHPDRSMSLNNIALYLSARYGNYETIDDVEEVIALDRDALALRPPGHPGRSISLTNLSVRLSMRYERLDTIEDLNEAIALGRDALALCPHGIPRRSESLIYLAGNLHRRFLRSGLPQDKEELFSLYTQIAHKTQIPSFPDLRAAREWVRVARLYRHRTTCFAYTIALNFLPLYLASLPSLPQHLDVLKELTSSLAVDGFSAFLPYSPAGGVESMEQGRGVFWTQLTRLRSPLDDVTTSGTSGKEFANKFSQLTSLIRKAIDTPGADQHDRLCHLNSELQKVIIAIRELPDLSRFLLTTPFSELQQAASGGPVIILNGSTYGCDALVILLDRDPVHIPLTITKERIRDLTLELRELIIRARSSENMDKYIAVLLRELWDQVVSPIVDCLQTFHPLQSRIWWCPTAEFSSLPLHAAGRYKNGEPKLSDLYISSYTPTLTALIRARRHGSSNPTDHQKCIVGIGQANATGTSELEGVRDELTNIGQRVGGLAKFTCIEGPESNIARVAEELNNNQWVHFACHGIPNQKEPFKSAFALHDGPFTIERIMRCELQDAEFAYLSACHTTVGDAESPDEMIHLASAMHFAGFRSVIGTMWGVADKQTKKITSKFYSHMIDESGRLDHTRAAFALHKTMRGVGGITFDQRILYVHIGA